MSMTSLCFWRSKKEQSLDDEDCDEMMSPPSYDEVMKSPSEVLYLEFWVNGEARKMPQTSDMTLAEVAAKAAAAPVRFCCGREMILVRAEPYR